MSGYEIGSKIFTKDPLAIMTRKGDRQWSVIMDLVLQALFYGEKYGLQKSNGLGRSDGECTKKTDDSPPTGQDFLNAIYCVGNYKEIFDRNLKNSGPRTEINKINNRREKIINNNSITNTNKDSNSNNNNNNNPVTVFKRNTCDLCSAKRQ